jgi:uncharacterized protein
VAQNRPLPIATPALANPAAIGLTGFGATTLLAAFHNFGWCGSGVLITLAFVLGGLSQFIAGWLEFKTGNTFGLAAFATYGAFNLAVGMILKGFVTATAVDMGFFFFIFAILTFIFFIGTLKQNGAIAFVFLSLLIGLVIVSIAEWTGSAGIKTFGWIVLAVSAISALYTMAHVVLGSLGIKLPVGGKWLKN